jgi:CRISPR/Cas system-associated endonuclease Cas3-HD
VFADPLSSTFSDPAHSVEEDRYITIGTSDRGHVSSPIRIDKEEFALSAPARLHHAREKLMKKKTKSVSDNDLRPEYDVSLIRGGVRGKYAERYKQGTNLVLLAPDVAAAFPDAKAVNEALRLLMRVAEKSFSHPA